MEIRYSSLLRAYGKLLTSLQREIAELYYNYDLSLSEIAEIKNVTRQSVEYTLKSARKALDQFEDGVGIVKLSDRLYIFADTLNEQKKKELIEILEK